MHKYFAFFLFVCLLQPTTGFAQADDTTYIQQWLMKRIDSLADTSMHGRGYVLHGRNIASAWLQKEFKACNIKPVGKKKSYKQAYSFPVNTFPGKMELKLNGTKLQPGKDYIIDATSHSFSGTDLKFERIDLSSINGNNDWQKMIVRFQAHDKLYMLENVDSACKRMGIRKHYLPFLLPKGCYIIPQKEKFTWTVECESADATVFYVNQEAIPEHVTNASAQVEALWINDAKSENIIGVQTGEVKDTFVAITAHYDHLGMMGSETIFPGASDNASGTAMLLYLASYFSTHPHHYSILYIAFSGEEPGLLGSEYFIRHPRVPLEKIKFLTNIDIMGDATDGITVVNATEFPKQFDQLQEVNKTHNYIPKVMSRGKAANSDHYYFTEAGVPSVFIYTNGGKGYYHDIFDKPEAITLNHVPGIAHLLIDFLTEIK